MQWKEPPGLKAESTCPCSFTDQEKTQTRVNHWTFLSASGTTGWTIWPLATGPLSLATSQLGGQAKVLINEMKMGSLQTASGDALIWTIQKDTLNRCSCLPLCPSSFILESLQEVARRGRKGLSIFWHILLWKAYLQTSCYVGQINLCFISLSPNVYSLPVKEFV